jgi:hypothetical protein
MRKRKEDALMTKDEIIQRIDAGMQQLMKEASPTYESQER